jgi:L-alanine-DL-glutamate epimerase-like enolase superfamily enzyme
VPIYGSGGWTSFNEDELVHEQMGYVERGIPRVKMKVAKDFGQSEVEDLRRLRAVRNAVGDGVEIYVDANNGFYAKQAIGFARRMGEYNVGWFEEPVLADDIAGLAAIAQAIDIPVATGEHEYTKYGFKDLIVAGGADIVQPDVGRVGGVTEWMKVAHLAHAFNLPVAPHAVQLVHLHLACCTPNLKVVEYLGVSEETDRLFYTDIPEPKDGMWSPFPDRPGLGLELNPRAIERYGVG